MLAAAADVKQHGPLPVPLHLRNAPTPLMKGLGYGRGYKYAHDYEGHVVAQQHLPDALARPALLRALGHGRGTRDQRAPGAGARASQDAIGVRNTSH